MKMSKKTKTILTSSVGILATTSVVAPLATMTSCSNKTSEVESQFDKEYGVTEQTYDDLKEEFINQYDAKLRLTIHDEGQIELRKDYLKKQLSSLDKMKDQRKNGFTSLTSAMMDFAKKDTHDLDGNPYNIKLSRKTKATWSQIDGLFNSWKGSFRQYMLNSDMPASTITRVMQDAQNKFVGLKKELQQTCNDALEGIIQAKSRIITCFEDVNDEIALVSSTMQLKEFLSQYVFESKADASDEGQMSCLDQLLKDTEAGKYNFNVGNVLTDKTMNAVFKITRKDDGKPITFTNTLVKGFTILPKLTKITANNLSNLYTFSMDFGLVKTSYIGKYSKEQLANVTAHTYIADNYDSSDINDESSLVDLIKKCAIKTIDYPIILTKRAEQDALEDAYFNKDSELGHISFNWDDKNADNQAYESFFDNAVKQNDGTWKAELSFNSLSNSCIRISDSDSNSSYKMVKDLIKDVTSRTGKDVHVNNLAEQFLKDCEISAIASIDEKNINNKIVKFDGFYANYNNSIYTRESDGKLNLITTDYDAYQKQCVNHSVSKAFFEKVNIKYNNAVAYVSLYDAKVLKAVSKKNEETKEEYLERVYQSGEEQKLLASLSLTLGVLATTTAVFEAWKPFSIGSTKKITIVSIIFLLVCLGLQAANYALFMEFYYKPLVKHVEDQRTTRKDLEDETKTKVIKILIEDSSNYEFIEEDGTYDKASFEQKRKNFNKHNMDWMLEQYKEYSTLNSPEWQKFDGILKAKGVGSEDYKTKFDDWTIGGKYWWISLGLTLFTLFASIGLGMWINHQRLIDEKQKILDKYLGKGQNETIEQQLTELDKKIQASFIKNTQTWFNEYMVMNKHGIANLVESCKECVVENWEHVLLEVQEEAYDGDVVEEGTPWFKSRAKDLQQYFNETMGTRGNFDWDVSTFADTLGLKSNSWWPV